MRQKNSSNIKTWYKDLQGVQKVINEIISVAIERDRITNVLNNPEIIDSLALSVNGLTKEQALLALSTKELTDAEKEDILIKAGIISTDEAIAKSTIERALASKGLSEEKQKEILNSIVYTDVQAGEATATATCTKAALLKAIADNDVVGADARAIVSALGLTEANTAEAVSFDLVAKAAGRSMLALAKNPFTWVVIGVTVAVTAIRKYIKAQEELAQSTRDAAETYDSSQKSLDEYIEKYQELHEAFLKAKGNEEATYNVKKQLFDLQTQLNEKYGDEYGRINLVTDAYKDQTEALRGYNNELSQSFLNENEKGIRQAKQKMEKLSSYNLSYTGISSLTDEGKFLEKVAKRYEKLGVKIQKDSDGLFSIHLDANPEDAYDTINSFMSDLRFEVTKVGKEDLFSDTFDLLSSNLNRANGIVTKFGDTYHKA